MGPVVEFGLKLRRVGPARFNAYAVEQDDRDRRDPLERGQLGPPRVPSDGFSDVLREDHPMADQLAELARALTQARRLDEAAR